MQTVTVQNVQSGALEMNISPAWLLFPGFKHGIIVIVHVGWFLLFGGPIQKVFLHN